jgi:hypothetical protein
MSGRISPNVFCAMGSKPKASVSAAVQARTLNLGDL